MANTAMLEDQELLRRYADEKSEAAFAELVQRRIGLVYSVALRQCGGDVHLAEDVAQKVFADLARKAASLCRRPVLSGWLCRSAQFAASDVVRAERRRRAREAEIFTMHETTPEPAVAADWEKLRPMLDQAMNELADDDRDALALRFFEERSFADIGQMLRLTEDAARKRVIRAVDRLHAQLARRGVTSTAAALGLALANQAGVAAPAGLAASVTGAALAAPAAAGWFTIFMSMSKLQVGIIGALVVAGVTGFGLQAETNAALRREIAAVQEQQKPIAALRAENQQLASAVAEVEMLRRDDAELKQLEQRAAEIKQTNRERARAAQASAQARVYDRMKELQAELEAMDRAAQEKVDGMNRVGNGLVVEYKALSTRARDGTLPAQANAEAEAAANAKMKEIETLKGEITTFIAKTRQALTESPQLAELRALQRSNPLPPALAEQRRVEDRRLLEERAAEIRKRTGDDPPPVGKFYLAPKQ